jgi:hypothetical protein
LVTILTITYEPDPQLLNAFLDSVLACAYYPLQLVVVDNGSTQTDVEALVDASMAGGSKVKVETLFARQSGNLGYARGTNIGISLAQGELVLMLNPDARLAPDAVTLLVDAAARYPAAVGFAPKILLSVPDVAIDSVGLSFHRNGVANQRGLGQVDIGQFDLEEQVSGVSFAAALIRRRAFARDQVGPLDERYFMFYEDVDWCMRAKVFGCVFWTIPSAKVSHFHSATTRHLGGGFKTRLIQRNLMWTVAKNLEGPSSDRILLRRTATNLARVMSGRQSRASAAATLQAWVGLPGLLRKRRYIQRRRRLHDRAFLSPHLDPIYFDVETYLPEVSIEALIAVLGRLYVVSPSPELGSTLARVLNARSAGMGRNRALIAALVREGDFPVGPPLEWLLVRLEQST